MGEETSDTMNLDLNLGPSPDTGSHLLSNEGVILDDLVDNRFDRIREAVRRRSWRWHQVQIPAATQSLSVEFDQFTGNSGGVNMLQAGEGSVAAEERMSNVPKTCETTNGILGDEVSEDRKVDIDKGVSNDGSFFNCNICLDLAREPVVTCCGHLFCWSCLYSWLHMHSDASECPVCKGEVTDKTLIPIYGRGTGNIIYEPEEESAFKIPPRPTARRVDSWRQTIQRTPLNLPVEEMIRSIGSRFDLARDRDRTPSLSREPAERTNSVLNRILTSGGIHGEQNTVVLDDIDFTPSTTGTDVMSSRIHSLYLQRQSHLRRAARLTSLPSALSSAERMVEAYFRGNPVGRNQLQPATVVDDRDSFSSIAAVINSESQMDTTIEIDSVVSHSASSSRRRNDVLRVSDVDSGDSRAHRRRRLN